MNRKCKRIISQNNPVEGTITEMKKHGWIKINTKPVRTHSLDGALFPYTVFFRYSVNGRDYEGRKFVGLNTNGLRVGGKITVYYDGENPADYALGDICPHEMY